MRYECSYNHKSLIISDLCSAVGKRVRPDLIQAENIRIKIEIETRQKQEEQLRLSATQKVYSRDVIVWVSI